MLGGIFLIIQSEKEIKLSVILVCFGNIREIEVPLAKTIERLSIVKESIEIIVVTDGYHFLSLDSINSIKEQFPFSTIVSIENEKSNPAILMNVGLKYIKTDYVTFAWAGSWFDQIIIDFTKNNERLHSVYTIKSLCTNKIPFEPDTALIYGMLQCTKLYDLNNIIVSKKAITSIGNFDESNILQKDFDWEYLLRLSRYYIFYQLGTTALENEISLKDSFYNKHYETNIDTISRYVVRIRPTPFYQKEMVKVEREFMYDLPNKNSPLRLLKRRFKITIIGGFWEYHHNQLAFFNYLDMLYGKGFATYKVILDFLSTPADVNESDLVIITRVRDPRILKIIERCEQDKITMIYMLDDNWLRIAEDMPDVYGNLFVKGNPQFDTFIDAIKRVDSVLTFNKNLRDDLKEYNKNVILFPLSVSLDFYKSNVDLELQKKGYLVIGYAGSLRHDNTAFIALSKVAKEYKIINVLLFGGINESQMKLFEDLNTISLRHIPYPQYCKKMIEISPDILIAPLVESMTTKSKCPNKYLETGAVMSAGIYSNVYPYNEVVIEGVTGLLVDENTQEAWESKLRLLIENKNLLLKIKTNCHNDIKKNYSTKKLIKQFRKLIQTSILKRDKND